MAERLLSSQLWCPGQPCGPPTASSRHRWWSNSEGTRQDGEAHPASAPRISGWSLAGSPSTGADSLILNIEAAIGWNDRGIVDLDSLTVIEYRKAGTAGLAAELFEQPIEPRTPDPAPRERPLDEVDRLLISELMADGRATYADLAPRVGLSQAGVRARVQRLLDDNTVVIQATSTARALGIAAFSAVLLSAQGPVGRIADQLAAMTEFTILALTSGSYDLAGEVWCRDNAHLLDTLDSIRSLEGVGSLVSNTYLEIEKEEYRLG